MDITSKKLFEKAKRLIPGGVNSPVRAFGSVGLTPLFIRKAHGSKIHCTDGNQYIDYVMSWGALVLGHSHPDVVNVINESAKKGTSYGAPTEYEIELAEMIIDAIPSVEMIRMVSSGTEAVMSAIRLARGFTGREKIIKFEGCYHGHADSLLVKAGSGVATLGIPGSPGVPSKLAELTITVPFNDTESLKSALDHHGDELACVIVEPIAGNMGIVLPKSGFLETLRESCNRKGILLIFDEVITGFRLTYGGYQNIIAIKPDLTCLGKIIGGGLPVGAFGGRRDVMEKLAPSGPIYQAGTLSGNPVTMAAGIATLKFLKMIRHDYKILNEKTSAICYELGKLFEKKSIPVKINQIGSMFTIFFTPDDVYDFSSAAKSDTALFARFFREMLSRGVNMAPSQFEAAFMSFAHTEEDLEKTIQTCGEALKVL